MEEITAYKLSNGTIVESKEVAERMEKKDNFVKMVTDFSEKHGYSIETKSAIKDAILENFDELLDMLKYLT